ncbi:MAG: alpha/beta fold hydrolase [Actinomycetota bacterium]
MEMQPLYIAPGGHKTRVVQAGVGPTVVVLHGWGGRIESMAPVIQCLAPAFHVVALDLPGFGESDTPGGAWGTPDYAAYVRDVVRELGVESASFIGHSFGAKTSLYLAATHDGLVEKVVAVGSSGLRSAPSLSARAKRVASKGAKLVGNLGTPGRALRDTIYSRVASQDYLEAGAMRPVLVKVVNEDLTGLLPRVRIPTLLVWGTVDDAVPVAHARRMEKLIPNAGLVLFEGAGHFAYLDDPQRFCRIIRHFLGAPLT